MFYLTREKKKYINIFFFFWANHMSCNQRFISQVNIM